MIDDDQIQMMISDSYPLPPDRYPTANTQIPNTMQLPLSASLWLAALLLAQICPAPVGAFSVPAAPRSSPSSAVPPGQCHQRRADADADADADAGPSPAGGAIGRRSAMSTAAASLLVGALALPAGPAPALAGETRQGIDLTPFNSLSFQYRGSDFGGLDGSSVEEPTITYKDFLERLGKGEVEFVEFIAPDGDVAYATLKAPATGGEGQGEGEGVGGGGDEERRGKTSAFASGRGSPSSSMTDGAARPSPSRPSRSLESPTSSPCRGWKSTRQCKAQVNISGRRNATGTHTTYLKLVRSM